MTYQKVKLSIILPVFNGGKDLEKNLKRFVNECNTKKFKNLIELCISDNNSTDDTKKKISKYQKILHKNKFTRIILFKNKKNFGFARNLMSAINISNGEYIMPLCDDSLPSKGFYNEIINYLKKNKFNELGFVPVNSVQNFKKKIFNINSLSYVISRGSILSGAIIKRKNFNKTLFRSNIYLHNIFYIDNYLKFGLKQILIKSNIKINVGHKQKIEEKFNDRAGRKTDFGVIEKIKTVDIFYKKKRISFFQFLLAISSIYSWSIEINMLLQKERNFLLSKKFFLETLKYNNKKIIFLSFILISLRNIFSNKFWVLAKLIFSNIFSKLK